MQKIKPKAYICLPWLSRVNCLYNDGVIGTVLWRSQFAECHSTAKHIFLILLWPWESEYLTAFTLFNNKREFDARVCQQVIKTGCHGRWCLTTLQGGDHADRPSLCSGYQEKTPLPTNYQPDSHQHAFGNHVKCQSCGVGQGLASFILTLKFYSAVKAPLNRWTRYGTSLCVSAGPL